MTRLKTTLLTLPFLLPFGCSKSDAPNNSTGKSSATTPDSNRTNGITDDSVEPSDANPDLSIPDLKPRPLVWIENWSAPNDEESEARAAARDAVRLADRIKASGAYAKAELSYEKAISLDPTWGYPPYQLACNYELSGQHQKAIPQFAKALELGFDDFPTALNDDELGKLRDDPKFPSQLALIRKRYIASSESRVGQPIGVRPQGDKPDGGWPVMLLLHGYGDTNISYLDFAEEWAKLGFVAVAVPGSVPGSGGRFIWNMDSIEPTQRDLQQIMASPLLEDLVNVQKVFLLGFSQGAMHAMLLTVDHPDQYAGVVGLSPGGSMVEKLINPDIRAGTKNRVMFIHGTEEPHAVLVDAWRRICTPAGWKFASQTHPGGHHFPRDWDTRRKQVATFLLD